MARTARRYWVLLGVILALAGVLRIYQLREVPAGLFCDEAALGYNAWAISHYGIDENGEQLPLFIWSFGGYKNPVFIYAAALPIAVFGLDEFGLRLTSALFGLGTVAAMFFLGRALIGPWVGLWAALLLAVLPWHLHFSRIAFELISFPFLFVVGFTLLVRFTQGRRTLPAAFFFLGSCLYAYAIAKLFIPLFLIGFGVLYLPTVWRRWKEWLLAVPVLALTVAPVIVFDLTHQRQGMHYFQATTILKEGVPFAEVVERYLSHYGSFFSYRFLFEYGDVITRHAVRGHGELYPFLIGLLVLGGLILLLRRDRAAVLVLWWVALYPAGASLMTEIPSASRGFIGAAAFCLVAAVGIAGALRALGWIARHRSLGLALQTAAAVGLLSAAYPQVAKYMHMYFREYVKYSAPTYGGFQYGYRDVIAYMEPKRDEYDLLMLTATDVNQPYIFALFYTQKDPNEFIRTRDPGYLILDPSEYRRYQMNQRILYSLRPSNLEYFSERDEKLRVVAPGGQVEFVVAEVHKRKQFITNWLSLGVFDNPSGRKAHENFIDVNAITKRQYAGKYGPIFWRRMSPQFIRIDFNVFYAPQDQEYGGNPEYVCAYALTVAEVDQAKRGVLEMSGSDDMGMVWLNGRSLTAVPQRFGPKTKRRFVDLAQGPNTLVVKTCETVGSWFITARLTDEEGRDLPGVVYRAEIPEGEAPAPPEKKARVVDLQVAEGFDRILRFRHTSDTYADYRGGTRSWWTYTRDPEPEVVWLTKPVPEKKSTAIAFTASMGEQDGDAELWINGEYALTFQLGIGFDSRSWERGAYRLLFIGKQLVSGKSGVFVLVVPPSVVTAGKPLELRVVPSGGDANAWFMVKSYADTAAFENVTPALIAEMQRPAWEE